MDYYTFHFRGLTRKLLIVPLGPKLKIASLNLLGDRELVEVSAKALAQKIKDIDFDVLVGPEVKVVSLLHALSQILGQPRYIVCRKKIHGYMINPITSGRHPALVLDGPDAEFIRNKKVAIIDDVISTGRTLKVMKELVQENGGKVVVNAVIAKQGPEPLENIENLIFLTKLPLLKNNTCPPNFLDKT